MAKGNAAVQAWNQALKDRGEQTGIYRGQHGNYAPAGGYVVPNAVYTGHTDTTPVLDAKGRETDVNEGIGGGERIPTNWNQNEMILARPDLQSGGQSFEAMDRAQRALSAAPKKVTPIAQALRAGAESNG